MAGNLAQRRGLDADLLAMSEIEEPLVKQRCATIPCNRKRCECTTWILQLDAGSKFQGSSSWSRDCG